MAIQIPKPTLVRLSDDWLPWRYQVTSYGNSKNYGYNYETGEKVISVSVANFEHKIEAEAYFALVS
jgi:hypothetical protein